MLEFLKGLFKDGGALSFDELTMAIEQHNSIAKEDEEINAVNLSQGGYVSKQKFDDKAAELIQITNFMVILALKCCYCDVSFV